MPQEERIWGVVQDAQSHQVEAEAHLPSDRKMAQSFDGGR
jgi:hypothetical protein